MLKFIREKVLSAGSSAAEKDAAAAVVALKAEKDEQAPVVTHVRSDDLNGRAVGDAKSVLAEAWSGVEEMTMVYEFQPAARIFVAVKIERMCEERSWKPASEGYFYAPGCTLRSTATMANTASSSTSLFNSWQQPAATYPTVGSYASVQAARSAPAADAGRTRPPPAGNPDFNFRPNLSAAAAADFGRPQPQPAGAGSSAWASASVLNGGQAHAQPTPSSAGAGEKACLHAHALHRVLKRSGEFVRHSDCCGKYIFMDEFLHMCKDCDYFCCETCMRANRARNVSSVHNREGHNLIDIKSAPQKLITTAGGACKSCGIRLFEKQEIFKCDACEFLCCAFCFDSGQPAPKRTRL
eukprot:tig00020675_g12590.t1